MPPPRTGFTASSRADAGPRIAAGRSEQPDAAGRTWLAMRDDG